MEFAILGLLLRGSQTLYQLRQAFAHSFFLIYGNSLGALQAAIKRAMNRGWITREQGAAQGRGQKPYTLSPEGRRAFDEWMMADFSGQDLETAALTRLFFLGELDAASRQTVLGRIQESTSDFLERLKAIQAMNQAHAENPEAWIQYRLLTLEYGLRVYTAAHRFFRQLAQMALQDGKEG